MKGIQAGVFLMLITFSCAAQSVSFQVQKLLVEGRVQDQKGEFSKAEESFRLALYVDSTNVAVRIALGILYHKCDRYEKALMELNTALQYDIQNADAHFVRANIYTDMGMLSFALSDYSQAIAEEPTMLDAYLNRGFLYSEMSLFENAINDFSIAIQIDRDAAVAHYSFMRVQGVLVLEKNCSYAGNQSANDIRASMVFNTFCF